MHLPKSLLQATVAGLALSASVACEKEDLELVEPHTTECADGCTDPEAHMPAADDPVYDCPACGMG